MQRYFDKLNNRLLYFERKALPDFWDEHWNIDNFKSKIEKSKNNKLILRNTERFLKKGRILEGGCGIGGNVYCLHYNGYTAFGVDFAKQTIKRTKEYFPELNVMVGDVRYLQFKDSFFDGYWSLGVIEHFYEGYDLVLKEMSRVLKKGGFIFLTFPYISPLRRFKAKIGFYKNLEINTDLDDFYQFVFDETKVVDDLKKYNFILKYRKPFDGLKGFKDEISIFKPILQKLHDYQGGNYIIYKLRSVISNYLAKFSAHMILMIFQNQKQFDNNE